MHDRIDGQRQIEFARPFRDLKFLFVAFSGRDAIGNQWLVAATDLHMTQPCIGQSGKFFPGQQHGRIRLIDPTSLAPAASSTRSLRAVGSPPK